MKNACTELGLDSISSFCVSPSKVGLTAKPPILLLHGLNGGKSQWRSVAERIGCDRPVVAVDLRGHGDSPLSDALDVETLIADISQVADYTGAPIHLVGASFGGVIALAVTALFPDKVMSVATVGTALEPPPTDFDSVESAIREVGAKRFFEMVARKYSFGPAPSAEMIEDAVALAVGVDVDTLCKRIRFGLSASPRPYIEKIGCPALVSVGEDDHTCPPTQVAPLAEELGVNLVVIPNGGHLVHVEQPGLVAEVLMQHVSRAEG